MASKEDKESRAAALGKDIVRAAAIDVTGRAIVLIGGSLVAAFALLVWKGGSVPAWLLVVVLALAVVAALAFRRHGVGPLEDELEEVKGERGAAEEDLNIFASGLERHETYARHVAQTLDALQRVVSGDIGVSIPHYIEQAVLEPARDLLIEKPAEAVRLSVLVADEEDERWEMVWAAGHSLPGKAKYQERIIDTLSRHAYETGEPQYWADVESDSAWRPNPLASAPTRTMMSLPVRWAEETLGVFNAISSEPDAFDPAEQTYLTSLGGVIAVAVAVGMQEASDAE